MSRPAVLIAALSGRALAAAARRAGFLPLVADCFGDADTREIAAEVRVAAGGDGLSFDPSALLSALGELRRLASRPPVGLVLGSGFEDRPELAAKCAEVVPILGNDAAAMRRTKDPETFFPLLDRLAIAHPEVRLDRPPAASGWLAKRVGGSGGRHIAWCDAEKGDVENGDVEKGDSILFSKRKLAIPDGSFVENSILSPFSTSSPFSVDRRIYFQRFAEGTAISLLAVASREAAAMVGASRQWCAPTENMPFRYGGAAGPVPLPEGSAREMRAAVRAAIRALDLVGLVSADFLLGAGPPLLVEINPRPGATLDLFDDQDGTLFRGHVDACRGSAPREWRHRDGAARAAAVLYADPGSLATGAFAWPAWTADRPRAGTRIAERAPVCTVFGEGGDADGAERSCRERMGALRAVLYARAPVEEALP